MSSSSPQDGVYRRMRVPHEPKASIPANRRSPSQRLAIYVECEFRTSRRPRWGLRASRIVRAGDVYGETPRRSCYSSSAA
ncbi:hypothetical protein COLSTE_01775 [Collinsella stercoris DSM 13279]|uniref:Uncharacterized protein n=1 Tax=Collinsella stercoris DSM 13279 TaxID=445975 RepID=B6GCF2_9ACTN|nr:hypothetical protein COLSTE_01775 [Collinsella stercoris DSM 13279]